MNELIKTFQIDWHLLIAQMVNFGIVLAVLLIFALKPLMKMMKERADKIEDGIKNAESLDEKIKEIEIKKEDEIKAGRREAQKIIGSAEKESEDIRAEKVAKTQSEAEKIVAEARRQILAEREAMKSSVKGEIGGLIADALNKISADTIDAKAHKKLIDAAIDDVKAAELK